MKRTFIIFTALILAVLCLTSCFEKKPEIVEVEDPFDDPFFDGLRQDPDADPIKSELADEIKKDMFHDEVYEIFGDPHAYMLKRSDDTPAIASANESKAYYKMDNDSVLVLSYTATLRHVEGESETTMVTAYKVTEISFITLADYEPIEKEAKQQMESVIGGMIQKP
ncbi:MAG: hypothetical protein E7616_00845 [Ruminococcaceae bacterium]|nr:hypothetical protein [Oscillospiraceae bacterium]